MTYNDSRLSNLNTLEATVPIIIVNIQQICMFLTSFFRAENI